MVTLLALAAVALGAALFWAAFFGPLTDWADQASTSDNTLVFMLGSTLSFLAPAALIIGGAAIAVLSLLLPTA